VRFLSFSRDGVRGLAVADADGVFHGLLENDADYPGDLSSILAADALTNAGKVLARGKAIDLASIRFEVPVPSPRKILCIGLNYADHSAESGMKTPDFPTVFARFTSGLVAHGEPLVCPRVSTAFDYEGEMVAVIGKGGRHIAEADALDHVVGYSVFNDGSVRDYQLRTPQWTVGKNFDGTGGFGPFFVTADELPRGAAGLRITTTLNGQVVQDASTDDLFFSVAKLVSLLSVAMTLEPGDIIVTGTPAGVGAARKPPLFMKAGDVCEVEVEGIGRLRNTVVAEA
jgi:2-keto-4-pentenoate hydratase/2-oxohepta-3-ene-1,7-dioic acid hydratase in catechol pathway